MPFSFDKRHCHLNGHINVRVELDGDDNAPASDFRLSGIMLTETELNELMEDKYAYRALFNTRGKLVEPMFRQIADIRLIHKYEKCLVTLYVGLNADPLKLSACKLKGIALSPQTGGLTEMSLTVQGRPTGDQMSELYTHQDSDQQCSMRFGKIESKYKGQPELPLGKAGDDDDGARSRKELEGDQPTVN